MTTSDAMSIGSVQVAPQARHSQPISRTDERRAGPARTRCQRSNSLAHVGQAVARDCSLIGR
ncbi:MAG: hypothetical protein ACREPM_21830, partial [Gemmatimonadaceae bacterium]